MSSKRKYRNKKHDGTYEKKEDSRRYLAAEDAYIDMLELRGEPEICKRFGCGQALSIHEKLFGKYCVHHQPHKQQTLK